MSIVTGPRHRTGQKSRLAVLFACAAFTLVPAASPFAAGVDRPTDRTGLIFTAMDRSVRPQDDFYGYANGTWLKNTPIPPDKSSYGLDNELTDLTLDQLHGILDKAAAAPRPPGSETQKIGELRLHGVILERAASPGRIENRQRRSFEPDCHLWLVGLVDEQTFAEETGSPGIGIRVLDGC